VSHLEEQLSAFVDGELTGADLDRASAHLAACERCRAEAAGLRELKRHLRGLAAAAESGTGEAFPQGLDEAPARGLDEPLTQRLLAMAGPGGPVPSRRLERGVAAPRAAFRTYQHGTQRPVSGPPGKPRRLGRRAGRRSDADGGRIQQRRRGWYLLWSVLSLTVFGIGAAAFSMGGAADSPGPKIVPQVEMFSVQHAITSGDVPIPESTQAPAAQPTP
jgi:anti-sigma factor RsiW